MQFTYYGHSCFALKINDKTFLFDPFIKGNELAKHIDVNAIPADYILVSHGHFDHTADLIAIAKRTGAKIISNYEIINWAQKQGITNLHPMNFGTANFKFGTLTYMQAQHSSSFEDGSYAGSPGGFILASEHGSFYYSGDTSLTLDMQLVSHYANVDIAILPIGGNFTMNVKDALKASELIKCNNRRGGAGGYGGEPGHRGAGKLRAQIGRALEVFLKGRRLGDQVNRKLRECHLDSRLVCSCGSPASGRSAPRHPSRPAFHRPAASPPNPCRPCRWKAAARRG